MPPSAPFSGSAFSIRACSRMPDGPHRSLRVYTGAWPLRLRDGRRLGPFCRAASDTGVLGLLSRCGKRGSGGANLLPGKLSSYPAVLETRCGGGLRLDTRSANVSRPAVAGGRLRPRRPLKGLGAGHPGPPPCPPGPACQPFLSAGLLSASPVGGSRFRLLGSVTSLAKHPSLSSFQVQCCRRQPAGPRVLRNASRAAGSSGGPGGCPTPNTPSPIDVPCSRRPWLRDISPPVFT